VVLDFVGRHDESSGNVVERYNVWMNTVTVVVFIRTSSVGRLDVRASVLALSTLKR
jgi:hypothetical protein